MEEASLGEYIKSADYDALAAELADLRQHLGTLTPGGSHTCITCAAHCVVIGDLEARIRELESQDEIHWKTRRTLLAERDRLASDKARLQMRIGELEAALHGLYDDNVDYLRLNNLGGYDNHWLVAARIALGFPVEPSVEPIQGGQLCHLCNAVHDLMSACPPKETDGECQEHKWVSSPDVDGKYCVRCNASDRGVAK